MKPTFEILCFILTASWASATISGISYMDPFNQKLLNSKPLAGEDPCNPLYWYPRQIPEYCYIKDIKPVKPKPLPVPAPQPLPPMVPMPPIAFPVPYPMPYPMPMFSPAMPPYIPQPSPQFLPPPSPMPYGVPLPPVNPMMPISYPHFPQQPGLVPGLPGLVTQDGGINILPFSDAYSDMLEKHKQQIIRKRLQKVLDDYDNYPRKRKHRKHRGRYY